MDREHVIKGLEFTKAMITFNPSTGEDIEPENLNEDNKITYDACIGAVALLKEQETVEGHWIPIESPTGVEAFGIKEMTVQVVRCSVCDAEEDVSFTAYRFCPRCGAKMEGSVK